MVSGYIFFVVMVSLLVFLYFYFEDEMMKLGSLIVLGLVIILVGIFSYFELAHKPSRLSRKLKEIKKLLPHESAEFLKDKYLQAHNIYVKLSDKHKAKFHEHLTKIHHQIEEHLTAEKKIQEISYNLGKTLAQQKKNYLAMLKHYEKLPSKIQQKYYHYIVQLKQKLEGGK